MASAVQTTVVHGSQLGEHKGITAPGVALPSEGLTAKDDEDLRFGLAAGVDMVALSFVQHVSDVRAARAVMVERWASRRRPSSPSSSGRRRSTSSIRSLPRPMP